MERLGDLASGDVKMIRQLLINGEPTNIYIDEHGYIHGKTLLDILEPRQPRDPFELVIFH